MRVAAVSDSGGSPGFKARIAATLYLVSGVFNGYSVFVLQKLVVLDDSAATASNILGSEAMFRLGFVSDITSVVFVVATIAIFYVLFRAVDGTVAVLAVAFGLLANAIQAISSFSNLASLLLLERTVGLMSVPSAQSQALALMFLQLHGLVLSISVFFFGVFWIMLGYLVFRSDFAPRLIGALVAVDGLGYLVASVAKFLMPSFAGFLYPYLPIVPVIFGEGSLMVWLLVKGVDEKKWAERGGQL